MYNDQTVVQPGAETPEKKSRSWVIVVVVVILVACCCLVSIAALLYFDPFDWGFLGRLTGGYDSIAKAIPEDANMYVSVDMLRFLDEDTRGVINAFAASAGDPDVMNRDEFISKIDKSLMESFGVTFSDDILPWIGQYIGVSFIDFELDSYGEPEYADWVLALESHDKKAVDEFISKIIDFTSKKTGYDFSTQSYKGTDIFELDTPNDYEKIAISHSKGILLISTRASGIQKAIDAQTGVSLSENQDYKDTMDGLPTQRLVTAFLSGNLFSDITAYLGNELDQNIPTPSIYQSMGISLAIIDDVIRTDVFTAFELDQLSEEQKSNLSSEGSSGEIAVNFPEDTLLFITGGKFGNTWMTIKNLLVDSMGGDEEDFDESMEMFGNEYGLNPDSELFPYLDGEWGLGLYRDQSGIINFQFGIPLGAMLVVETSNQSSLDASINKFMDNFGGFGLITIKEKTISGVPLYVAAPFLLNTTLLSFGTFENHFLLGTNDETLAESFNSDQSLANYAQYKDVWTKFDSGMNPVFYMNFTELTGFMEDYSTEELGPLDPIMKIAIANSPLKDNTTHLTIFVYVDTQ